MRERKREREREREREGSRGEIGDVGYGTGELRRVAEARGGLMHQHQSGLPVQLLHSTHWPPPLVQWCTRDMHTDHGDRIHACVYVYAYSRARLLPEAETVRSLGSQARRRILHSSAFNWTDINLKK